MSKIIQFNNICKEFKISIRKKGIWGSIKGLFKRDYKIVQALKDVSFEIEEGVADIVLTIPEFEEVLMPMPAVVPLQLIAYYTSVLRGNDADKPRNLAKAVTVE